MYSNAYMVPNLMTPNQPRHPIVVTPADFNALYTSPLAENDAAKREAAHKKLNKMAIDDYCLVVPLFCR